MNKSNVGFAVARAEMVFISFTSVVGGNGHEDTPTADSITLPKDANFRKAGCSEKPAVDLGTTSTN